MEDNTSKDIEVKIIDTVASNNLQEISQNIAEAGIDALLDDGVLKDFPIVGTAYKLAGAVLAIKENLLRQKLKRFLLELDKVPQPERESFIWELKSKEKRSKVGENILLLLDRLDQAEKANIVGRIFAAHMQGKIDYSMTTRLSSIIERVFLSDLDYLKQAYQETNDETYLDDSIAQNLAMNGLMTPQSSDSGMSLGIGPSIDPLKYSVNSYGKLLVEIALLEPVD